MAAEGREQAAQLQHMFDDGRALAAIRRDLAHLLLYPYSTAELLYRYAKANGAIMNANVLSFIEAVRQPALVVASESDQTTHAQGSRHVAELLTAAQLSMTSDNHLAFFDAPELTRKIALDFIGERLECG